VLLITCPWCGPRDETEYHYGGQAHVPYPADPAALTDEEAATLYGMRWGEEVCQADYIPRCGLYPST